MDRTHFFDFEALTFASYNQQKPLDDQKLSQYTQGTVRKSRREKEKEAAEAKKKEEEENAAIAYADFLDAFEGEDAGRKRAGSTFVRSLEDARTPYQPSARGAVESSRTRILREEMEEVRRHCILDPID